MKQYLLKNGLIMDGTGDSGYYGDVLIEGKRIVQVGREPIACPSAEEIDCTGLAVAPGFIDGHSHQDFYLLAEDPKEFFEPFLKQGITSFVCGNCGFGAAGFQKNSPYKHDIFTGFLAGALGNADITWDTWPEYLRLAEEKGMMANVAVLAAHGAALGSIIGPGTAAAGAVTKEVENEVLEILEQGIDDGCKGVSLGLAYRPGNFTTPEQMKNIAGLVAKKHKLLTVHREVETSISGHYAEFSEPHNVRWLREFFDNIKDTGVSVHISHLLYAGRSTWPSYQAMRSLIDEYAAAGLDVTFDMYSYEYGASEIAILVSPEVPRYFQAMKTDKALHDRLEQQFQQSGELIGLLSSDIFLSNPYLPEYEPYMGMFLDEMAKVRGMSEFDNVVDIYEHTDGHATVMLGTYYSPEMTIDQMTDPKVDYMTDAWIDPGCAQNPAAYGSMPRFLRLARETGNLTLEQAVHKMTGKTAKRFDLTKRGLLRNGYYADVTVFDPARVGETADGHNPSGAPIGIQKVFINGQLMVDDGELVSAERPGMQM